jgi:RNA polymerase sigma-70 factor (ECF subfamily)
MQQPIGSAFIERLKNGDRQALEEWYDHSAPALLAISMRYADSVEEAEDILQNALMKLLKALSAFDYTGPGRFEAWTKRIVVNTALLQLREKAKSKHIISKGAEYQFVVADNDEEEEEPAFRPDPEVLIQWIQQLPAGYRTVLNLYVFEEYSHKQIAETLGISENTSKSQLSKARSFLRRMAAHTQVELQKEKNG